MRQTALDARRREACIQTILDHISDGVLSLDEQGRFLSANPALLKMIPEDRLRQLDASLEETLRWRQAVFSVSTFPVPGLGSVLIFRDETRRHETERAKESLLATVSHELRTPLGVVMNYIELLMMFNQTGRVDTDQFREYLLRALQNSRRLDRLVNAILDQAQLEAGMVQLNEQVFNLHKLLEHILASVQPLARDKRLGVALILAPDLPVEMRGDAERLQKVLINLLDNAIKFTPHGIVKLKGALLDTRTVSIEVIDSGPGIPRTQLPDVFEPFRRASDYAEREHQGAGLGLSIAKQIIMQMGGKISVSSFVGMGTTFTIHLPLRR
jgi:signal transduction histidine kinase